LATPGLEGASGGPQGTTGKTYTLRVESAGFEIESPVPLVADEIISVATPVGVMEVPNYLGTDDKTLATYTASSGEPPGGFPMSLNGAYNGTVEGMKVTSKQAITLGDAEGYDFTATKTENGIAVAISGRVYVRKRRLYTLLVLTPIRDEDRAAAIAYLDSFHFLP